MSPRTWELIDLVVRWVHVIAGIMWVGNSLLFNWLDRILTPSSRGEREGMQGETWLIHSGGFYLLEKTLLVGQQLPRPLHWFKHQAYTTWWSGLALLFAVYYVGGRAAMVGDAHPEMSHAQAAWIGAGAIIATWLLYELLWSVVQRWSRTVAAIASLVALVALCWGLTHLLSGRAAFIHIGAALGTLMAWNVVHVVIPSQRALIRTVREGAGCGADKTIGDRAKTRSIHNNYLVFPVVVLMVSSHFPSFYAHKLSWLLVLLLIASGAAVRHVMNIRFTYRNWVPVLVATVAIAVVSLYGVLRFDGRTTAAANVPRNVTFEDARHVIDRRCSMCHSSSPVDLTFGPAPGGVAFDTPAQINAFAPRIHERAVVTRTMPPANKTRMTESERAILGAWAARPSR